MYKRKDKEMLKNNKIINTYKPPQNNCSYFLSNPVTFMG